MMCVPLLSLVHWASQLDDHTNIEIHLLTCIRYQILCGMTTRVATHSTSKQDILKGFARSHPWPPFLGGGLSAPTFDYDGRMG
jgi:hypothetical protein